jgi:DNA polymerase-3 subunit alpha
MKACSLAHLNVPTIDVIKEMGNEKKNNEDNYLEYLSFVKAKQIYGDLLPKEVLDRLKYELQIIKHRGASGYFLFIHDVVNTAQSELDVWIGPGRGSAAGCLVCYCLGITKVDPLRYGLLFERFLNPDGILFPDIDIDTDNEGRERIISWLQQKYGKECCAHIATGKDLHQCGFVVADEPISNLVSISTLAIEDLSGRRITLNCVQYKDIESSSLIKYDFIGLDTLTQMKEICELIKIKGGKDIDIEKIPIDDNRTMKLFQNGQTDDIFLFSSNEMKRNLQDFHPTSLDDLVILNCLYRPGSMDDIAAVIKQKYSTKPIEYIIPCMKSILHNTYGNIVYQEQIMMLSRLIANFNKNESALLRMAIGMFKKEMLPALKNQFIRGGTKNGYKKTALEKLWNEIESKGRYVFNKSHSVGYTWLAYQMAYLKANYSKEFVQVMEKYHS